MENIELPNGEEMDELWNENPPDKLGIMSDTEIRKAQLEHQRSYHRKYYHEHKKPVSCPFCGNDYSSVSSLRRHQGRSSKCAVQRLVREVELLKRNLIELNS
jgi:hypothetical protein